MEPVPVDLEIELSKVMINEMSSSLKKFEKKLHDVELFMHYQPTKVEHGDGDDKVNWQKKLETLLREETVSNFPTLTEIRREWKKTHPDPVVLSTGEVLDKRKGRNFIIYKFFSPILFCFE